mgnify:CR=1 FL=1
MRPIKKKSGEKHRLLSNNSVGVIARSKRLLLLGYSGLGGFRYVIPILLADARKTRSAQHVQTILKWLWLQKRKYFATKKNLTLCTL